MCNPHEKLCARGITEQNVSTLATVDTQIQIPNFSTIHHKFHIVDSKFNLNCSGIIGRDFLIKFNCNVNFREGILDFEFENSNFSFELCYFSSKRE